MTSLQQYKNKMRKAFEKRFRNPSTSPWSDEMLSFLDTVVEESYLKGRNDAVDYLDDQVESFMDLETKEYPDCSVEQFNELLKTARNSVDEK